MPDLRPRIVGNDSGAAIRPRVTRPPRVGTPSSVTPQQAAPVTPKPPAPSSFGTPGALPQSTDAVQAGLDPAAVLPSLDQGGAATGFAALNADALEAALRAIEAEYGLTREQLMAEQSAIGQEYQLLNAQAQRAREAQLENVEQGALERGIFQSGITAEGIADTELAFADQFAQLEAGESSARSQIQGQLAQLEQQEELARLAAEREAEQRALDLEVLQLLAAAGL